MSQLKGGELNMESLQVTNNVSEKTNLGNKSKVDSEKSEQFDVMLLSQLLQNTVQATVTSTNLLPTEQQVTDDFDIPILGLTNTVGTGTGEKESYKDLANATKEELLDSAIPKIMQNDSSEPTIQVEEKVSSLNMKTLSTTYEQGNSLSGNQESKEISEQIDPQLQKQTSELITEKKDMQVLSEKVDLKNSKTDESDKKMGLESVIANEQTTILENVQKDEKQKNSTDSTPLVEENQSHFSVNHLGTITSPDTTLNIANRTSTTVNSSVRDQQVMLGSENEQRILKVLKDNAQTSRESIKEVTIKMSPEHLGPIKIQMKVTNQQVDLVFKLQSAQTKEMFESVTKQFMKVLDEMRPANSHNKMQVMPHFLLAETDSVQEINKTVQPQQLSFDFSNQQDQRQRNFNQQYTNVSKGKGFVTNLEKKVNEIRTNEELNDNSVSFLA